MENTQNRNFDPEMMALPKNLDEIATTQKKRQHLFSGALFRESFKSNKKSLFVVSGANALLMMLVIIILSTLSINATSNAMKNLFSSADSETTLRQGAATYYTTLYGAASSYEEANSELSTLESSLESSYYLLSDADTQSSIDSLLLVYQATYALTSGDAQTKHNAGKEVAVAAGNAAIDADSTLTSQEKIISKLLIANYLDYRYESGLTDYASIMEAIIPDTMGEALVQSMGLSSDREAQISDAFSSFFTLIDSGSELAEAKASASFPLAVALSDQDEATLSLLNEIQESYLADPESYINDATYRANSISDAVLEQTFLSLKETAYYSYLPSFEVKYETSELGWPIEYVGTGEYDEYGDEILKMIEIKSYQPERFIEVDGGLGTPANLLQKMRKEAITGEAYTDEEIESAKEEASEELEAVEETVTSFMGVYLTRGSDGTNAYYDGSQTDEQAIIDLSISLVYEAAAQQLIDEYNEENDTHITSIEQITSEDGTASGIQSMNAVYSYASGAIASYRTIYSAKLSSGYSQDEARLIAMVNATSSVMSQLPTDVNDSLSEMGESNTYGIVVGMIGFAIAGVLIPMAYMVMLSNSLVAQKVENGSLAFTFSNPTKRSTYIFTQGLYMIFSATVMAIILFGLTLATRCICVALGNTDFLTSLPIEDMAMYAFGNYMLSLALSGICFLSSSIFNKSSEAIGLGGGISIFFFICAILGIFGSEAIPGTARIEAMDIFNYATIFSLFDAHAVIVDDVIYWYKLIGLAAISLVCYLISVKVFEKKDLPL